MLIVIVGPVRRGRHRIITTGLAILPLFRGARLAFLLQRCVSGAIMALAIHWHASPRASHGAFRWVDGVPHPTSMTPNVAGSWYAVSNSADKPHAACGALPPVSRLQFRRYLTPPATSIS